MKKIAKLLFLCVAPALLAVAFAAFLCCDLLSRLRRMVRAQRGERAQGAGGSGYQPPQRASIVIPNWNAKDLLEKYLPAVIAACSAQDEIIVVDNASSDGSAAFIHANFPRVRVIEADRNLGFGGGSNLGIREARNRIAVLLNND